VDAAAEREMVVRVLTLEVERRRVVPPLGGVAVGRGDDADDERARVDHVAV
jgi:hypothetical protein